MITSFTLYGILYYFSLVLTFISWGYIFVALVFAVIRLIAGKKSKTLEGFGPEEFTIEFDVE